MAAFTDRGTTCHDASGNFFAEPYSLKPLELGFCPIKVSQDVAFASLKVFNSQGIIWRTATFGRSKLASHQE
jgi:hypothetical protein